MIPHQQVRLAIQRGQRPPSRPAHPNHSPSKSCSTGGLRRRLNRRPELIVPSPQLGSSDTVPVTIGSADPSDSRLVRISSSWLSNWPMEAKWVDIW